MHKYYNINKYNKFKIFIEYNFIKSYYFYNKFIKRNFYW
jgi:hypothetical protein